MNEQVAQRGKQAGLDYNFDKVVVANTFKAHRFLHFAKKEGKQNEAEELLFKAFFTDGLNIDDSAVLIELGAEIGLKQDALKAVLESNDFASDVKADIEEAHNLGINGVPFFVFNRKYGISGAQETPVFLETLEKSFAEWKKDNPGAFLEITDGDSCTPDGECD